MKNHILTMVVMGTLSATIFGQSTPNVVEKALISSSNLIPTPSAIVTSSVSTKSTPPNSERWGVSIGYEQWNMGGTFGMSFPTAKISIDRLNPTSLVRVSLGMGLANSELSDDNILVGYDSSRYYFFREASLLNLSMSGYLRGPWDMLYGANGHLFLLSDGAYKTSVYGYGIGLQVSRKFDISDSVSIYPYIGVVYDMPSKFHVTSGAVDLSDFSGVGYTFGVHTSLYLW